MLAEKARCMEEEESMMRGLEAAGLREGRLPVRPAFPPGAFPSNALKACMQPPQAQV